MKLNRMIDDRLIRIESQLAKYRKKAVRGQSCPECNRYIPTIEESINKTRHDLEELLKKPLRDPSLEYTKEENENVITSFEKFAEESHALSQRPKCMACGRSISSRHV